MKKYLFSLIFLSIIILSCRESSTTVNIDNDDVIADLSLYKTNLISYSNDFGLKLFKELNKSDKDKNIFISPLSVSFALGMVLNGANASTADEIKSTLLFDALTQKQINIIYKSILNELQTNDNKITLSLANSIWSREGFEVENEFLELSKKYFSSYTGIIDFSLSGSYQIINKWVEDNTNGKIKDLVEPNIPPETMMFLINAIYFKGNWKYTFDSELTKEDNFYIDNTSNIKLPMMRQAGKFNHFSNSDIQIIELPYGNSSFSMLILLPNADINSFITTLDLSTFNNYLSNLSADSGNIYLPKFKIEYDIKLNSTLSGMGMPTAFTPQADFTGIHKPGGIYIDQVKHKTFLEVNEEGTEAAGATLIKLIKSSVGPFNMVVNKPFLLVIKENKTSNILFIGKILKPE